MRDHQLGWPAALLAVMVEPSTAPRAGFTVPNARLSEAEQQANRLKDQETNERMTRAFKKIAKDLDVPVEQPKEQPQDVWTRERPIKSGVYLANRLAAKSSKSRLTEVLPGMLVVTENIGKYVRHYDADRRKWSVATPVGKTISKEPCFGNNDVVWTREARSDEYLE